MKKLIILALLTSACATAPTPKIEDLMRDSYFGGCTDTLQIVVHLAGKTSPSSTEQINKTCHLGAAAFDPHDVKGFEDDLEVTRIKTHHNNSKFQ